MRSHLIELDDLFTSPDIAKQTHRPEAPQHVEIIQNIVQQCCETLMDQVDVDTQGCDDIDAFDTFESASFPGVC